MTTLNSFLLVLATTLVCTGCDREVETLDEPDAGQQTGTDATPPPGGCDDGEHLCGGDCVADQANTPGVGCRLGCGEPCWEPELGSAFCTEAGSCDFSCTTGTKYNNDCVSALCWSLDLACGTVVDDDGDEHDCGVCAEGIACTAHRCAIPEDALEPNDSLASAHDLGEFEDTTFDDYELEVIQGELNIHDLADEDWFTFRMIDGPALGNPRGSVDIYAADSVSSGNMTGYEIAAWYQCDTGDNSSVVYCSDWQQIDTGEADDTYGPGCRKYGYNRPSVSIEPECEGLDESGTVIVRVRKLEAAMGEPYQLRVEVE